jgi:phosphinothricin acetyltransferase
MVYGGPRQVGRAIGRALLARLIGRCEALGLPQRAAVIGDSRHAGPIGLRRTAGFVQVGPLPAAGFACGRWVDGVLMQTRSGLARPPYATAASRPACKKRPPLRGGQV